MGQYDNLRANALTLSKAGLLQTANKLNRLADYLEGKRTSLKDLSVIYSDTGEDGNDMVELLRLQPELKSVINNAMYDAAVVMKTSGSPVASEVLSDMNKISDTGINDDDSDDDNPLCITAINDNCSIIACVQSPRTPRVQYNIVYKVNSGTWLPLELQIQDTGGTVITMQHGDKVYFKGNREGAQSDGEYLYFRGSREGENWYDEPHKFDVSGNVMSIAGREEPQRYELARLFNEMQVVDASGLIMPSVLSEGCCAGMFQGNAYLQYAPVLPAEQLRDRCYELMFSGCEQLGDVTCLAQPTDQWAIDQWLYNVSRRGTLHVKHEGEWNLPEGWHIELITD